ncbi:hypothetical protein P6166_08630 [Stenotrophomonas sp. HITSZ_GD]|uniref:hypothetical protein n=1 Tax=Stenotrophomonas sp. HITSZ_GD TaxID=3037248 RepID=UPI00240E45E9|nr:hypothetical protein [Stenotrophomonas sp. HITSZ_GD]MDG2525416.1 hypothetical protein [Stenotrophomonas sp. HITSZ_GD]
MMKTARSLALPLLLALPFAAGAQSYGQMLGSSPRMDDPNVAASEAMEDAHPDQRFRRLGYEAAQKGRTEDARRYYRTASRYGDKISQAALAELMWTGQGGETDRALGYAWMDLAAERGTPYLLAKREHYWEQMDDGERQRALQEGVAVYSAYGDKVAKPRLERVMRKERTQVTGSRTGFVGTLDVYLMEPSTASGSRVIAQQYYQGKYWQPDEYWKHQDKLIERQGKVHVGAVEIPDETPAAPKP